MKSQPLSTRAGLTLVEVAITATLLGAVVGTAVVAMNLSTRSYGVETAVAALDDAVQRSLQEVCGVLRETDLGALTPAVSPPASSATVDFQRAAGYAAGAVEWGPTERLAFEDEPGETADGDDDDGDGLVDEGRLVRVVSPGQPDETRVVLCSGVPRAAEDELLGNGVDDNGNGLVDEAGFCVTLAGGVLVVRLTLATVDSRQGLVQRSGSRVVAPRNTDGGGP